MSGDVKLALVPCPFCAANGRLHRDEYVFAGQVYPDYPNQPWGVRVECEGACHAMTCWWHTEEQAAEAWNRRASPSLPTPDAEPVAWKLSFVGDGIFPASMSFSEDAEYVAEIKANPLRAARYRIIDYYTHPATAPDAVALREEGYRQGVEAGWSACRKSVYAVCEDVDKEAEKAGAHEGEHAKGYSRGMARAAKSIARGFGAMEAIDDDNVRSLSPPPAGDGWSDAND